MRRPTSVIVIIPAIVLAGCASTASPFASAGSSAVASSAVVSSAAATSVPSAASSPSPSAPPSMAAASPNAAATPVSTGQAASSPSSGSASVVPPAPTGVSMDISSTGFGGTASYELTWSEAVTNGVTMRIYGVTACLNAGALSSGQDSVPCLVPGMRLPASALTLVSTAPAAAGKATWTSAGFGDIGQALAEYGGKDFYAFVIGAYDAAGHSKLSIAQSSQYCPSCLT